MRRTVTVVGVATGLVMTATGSYASAPDDEGSSHAQLQGFSVSAEARSVDDAARKCLPKKKVKRVVRAYKSRRQIMKQLGKGRQSGYSERSWKTCYDSHDLTISFWGGKRRPVQKVQLPEYWSRARTAATAPGAHAADAGARRCVTKKEIRHKVRPYMTYRRTAKALGNKGRGSGTYRYWAGCGGGWLNLSYYRGAGKLRLAAIEAP